MFSEPHFSPRLQIPGIFHPTDSHSRCSVSVLGSMSPTSRLKMKSPPGKNGSVGRGKFVVILARNRIMFLVIVCSLVMGGIS